MSIYAVSQTRPHIMSWIPSIGAFARVSISKRRAHILTQHREQRRQQRGSPQLVCFRLVVVVAMPAHSPRHRTALLWTELSHIPLCLSTRLTLWSVLSPLSVPFSSLPVVPVPSDYGLPYEDLQLRTPDGVQIHAFLLRQREHLNRTPPPNDTVRPSLLVTHVSPLTATQFAASRPTVIMFHGNAGNHGHRIPLAKMFYAKMRCNVLLVSYRGYGLSEGTPSEKGHFALLASPSPVSHLSQVSV